MKARLIAIAIVCAWASQAHAQTTTSQGPLVIERIDEGFAIAPDFKVTDIDGRTGSLVGGYAGWVTDRTLFIGGAGYWLANRERDFKIGYGGVMAEWMLRRDSAIRFGVRGLAGIGTATLGTDVSLLVPAARFGVRDPRTASPLSRRVVVRDDFVFAEPTATMRIELMRHLDLNLGAGYRFTGATDGLRDRLNGASGSIGVEIGY